MLNSFICGSYQSHQLEDDQPWNSPSSTPNTASPSATPNRASPSATPKRSSPCVTPRETRKSSKNSKNPYSSRGLDKFSALLAELEEKKRKIYSEMGTEDVPMVRFVYSSSNDCIPVIVKVKDQKQLEKPKISTGYTGQKQQDKHKISTDIQYKPTITHKNEVVDKLPVEITAVAEKQVEQPRVQTEERNEKKYFAWNMKLHKWRRPSYYMPVAIVLILLLLVFFGRSVAILWICVGWYIVPTLSTKKPTKKKEYARRLSENKMVINHGVTSPKRKGTGELQDPYCIWPQQGQRKSF